MTILEYIKIDDMEHLSAIRHLFKKGVWPKSFVKKWPNDLCFTAGWQASLAFELAERYVDGKIQEKLK